MRWKFEMFSCLSISNFYIWGPIVGISSKVSRSEDPEERKNTHAETAH